MNEAADFKEARRRRRRKNTIRRTSRLVIVLIIVAALALVGYVGYRLDWGTHISNLFASLRSGSGYPVALDQSEVTQLIGMNGSVAVCDSGSVSVYNTKGEMTGYYTNSYTTPHSEYAGGKLLTYDLGGTGWMVTNKTKVMHTQSDDGTILAGTLNEKGYIALSRRNTAYVSEVTVYNTRYEQMFIWDSADTYVNCLAISHKGTMLATGGVLSAGGALTGEIKLHDMTGRQKTVSITLPECIILSMVWTQDGKLQVVTDRGLRLFNESGEQLAAVTFAETPVAAENAADGMIFVAAGDYRSTDGATVTAYDSALQPVGTVQLKKRVLSLKYENKHLYILTEGQLLLGDASLTEVTDRGRSTLQLLAPYGNAYYGITNEGLTYERL